MSELEWLSESTATATTTATTINTNHNSTPPANKNKNTYSWMTPLCNEAHTHGRTGWKAKPFTRADLDSNLVNIVVGGSLLLLFVRSLLYELWRQLERRITLLSLLLFQSLSLYRLLLQPGTKAPLGIIIILLHHRPQKDLHHRESKMTPGSLDHPHGIFHSVQRRTVWS